MSHGGAASADAILSLTVSRPVELGSYVREILRRLREHLGMRVAFVSEFRGDEHVVLFVDAAEDEGRIAEGRIDPIDQALCRCVANGDMPQLLADARDDAVAARLDATMAFPICAHISVPLSSPSRGVFGALCCFDTVANEALDAADLDLVRLVAQSLSRRLGGPVSG